jgi:hypothetical protein
MSTETQRGQERRASLRVPVRLDLSLSRGRGSPLIARTLDLGTGGMRVATRRPLSVDEVLAFVVQLGGIGDLAGRARVLRQYASNVYALRFEQLGADATSKLASFVLSAGGVQVLATPSSSALPDGSRTIGPSA